MEELLPYHNQMVEGLWLREVDSNADVRKATALARCHLHIIEHLYDERPKFFGVDSAKKAIASCRANDPAYAAVIDIANASKHKNISRPDRWVTSIADLNEEVCRVEHCDSKGYYYSHQKMVTASLNGKKEMNLSIFLQKLTSYWVSNFITLKLIPSSPVWVKYYDYFFDRALANEIGPVVVKCPNEEALAVNGRTWIAEGRNLRRMRRGDHSVGTGHRVLVVIRDGQFLTAEGREF